VVTWQTIMSRQMIETFIDIIVVHYHKYPEKLNGTPICHITTVFPSIVCPLAANGQTIMSRQISIICLAFLEILIMIDDDDNNN
jgi:hypothetical protein